MKLQSARIALPSFPRHLIAAAAFALCTGQALAIEPFVVKDIRVEGIQRTEAGTVFSYLPVRVGETFTDEKGSAAIKALYATGFFKDVRVEAEGDVLVVMVEERPAIAGVDFSGIKEFDKDQLTKALKEIGLAESRIFDRALVDRAEQELKRQYLSRGLYGAKVTTTVTPIERNRVNITFSVDEGDAARIKQITFVGNKVYTDKQLRNLLNLTTPGWFTWYTKADQYTKQKLAGDIETIKSHYLNNGYLEAQVESTQVSISPDKKNIYITININEGEKFKVADVKLEGELLGREQELKSLVELKKGDIYSGEKLAESVKKISERMGTFGYAFANVNANPDINREKREVAFTVFIDPGKRVYVRRVNVTGNTITRDEVVRREFRQFESSWYDGDKIKNSRNRVDRLGYFNEVNIDTPEVPGTTDQVDVNVSVAEKPTGTLSLGAGFSSSERVTASASIHQANAFGSGNNIGLDVNTSKYNRTIALSHVAPYVTDDGISRSVDIYYRTSRPPLVNTGEYKIVTMGGSINHGIPFSDLDTVYFGFGIEKTKVEVYRNFSTAAPINGSGAYTDSPQVYLDYVRDFGGLSTCTVNCIDSASTTSFPLTVAWQRDNRDSVLTPSKGQFQRANLELATFGDQRYYRAVYQYQHFRPVFDFVTLAFNGELDYGAGLGNKPYPVFKNFYAGGIGSVRGFEGSSLGPRSGNDFIGGSKRVIGNVELQFPFPGSGKDRSLKWFTFADAGNVFADSKQKAANLSGTSSGGLRYSVGVGISWISPIGPLKISYGKPLNAKADDRQQQFQFQLGTGF